MGVCTFAGLIYSKQVTAIYAYIIKQKQLRLIAMHSNDELPSAVGTALD